jgi:hypothetical protein
MFLFKVTNGKRVRISGYELWKIDIDGLIAESKGHFDSAEYKASAARRFNPLRRPTLMAQC